MSYGDTILSDRGPHPKNAGDRAYKDGRTIPVEANEDLTAGDWVDFGGSGGVNVVADPATNGADAVVQHDASSGETASVHTGGVIRANEVANNAVKIADFPSSSDVLVYFS